MNYVQGDLIELFKQGHFDAIGHQCNCMGAIKSGVAGAIVKEWPEIYEWDSNPKNNPLGNPVNKFGNMFAYPVDTLGYVFNMYSQYLPGPCSTFGIDSLEVRLGALRSCLKIINNHRDIYKVQEIAFPLIASGLAADLDRKGDMTDMEYFDRYIADTIRLNLRKNMNITIVYR